jgi:hypothetical protein
MAFLPLSEILKGAVHGKCKSCDMMYRGIKSIIPRIEESTHVRIYEGARQPAGISGELPPIVLSVKYSETPSSNFTKHSTDIEFFSLTGM